MNFFHNVSTFIDLVRFAWGCHNIRSSRGAFLNVVKQGFMRYIVRGQVL
jgi:hypothetical protein